MNQALLLLVGMALLFPMLPRDKPWARFLAVAILEWACLRYLHFRWFDAFPRDLFSPAGLWQFAFLCAETVALGHTMLTGLVLVRHKDRRGDADRYEADLIAKGDYPTVDVLIPTYNEPEPVLRKTMEGCLGIAWPRQRLTIHFLDDGGRDWLRDLCKANGINYHRRAKKGGGKAGNLNYALAASSAEYICCLDADFIPAPRILTRLVPLCRSESDIGLVQTPQHYDNPDPVQWNLAGKGDWTEEQRFFCDVVEPSRDAWNAAFCIGTGWVAKRSAINAIGGKIPEDTVCEDMYTTYTMRGHGIRTIYLDEALAYGLAAESIGEYTAQRVRWCQGTVQTLYAPYGMLRCPNLSIIDRILYFDLIWYWSGFTFLALLAIAPAVYWFLRVPVFEAELAPIAAAVLPRVAATLYLTYWLSGGKVVPLATEVKKTVLMWNIVPAFWQALWRPENLTFRVTNKGVAMDKPIMRWAIAWPFLAVLLLNLLGMGMNLSASTQIVEWDQYMVMNLLLSLYGVVLAFLCLLACVDRPKGAGYWDRSQTLHGSFFGTVAALWRRWTR